MRYIYYFVFACVVCAAAVRARRLTMDDEDSPIRVVETSFGQGDHERVDFVEAVIYPRHVKSDGHLDFPTSGSLNDYFVEARAPGDARGHIVAAQFSGPVEWYNLSPQNPHVNRNEDFMALTMEWYKAECKVRTFLSKGDNHYVSWRVTMTYVKDSNRPHQYHLTVNFLESDQNKLPSIDIRLGNPFLSEDRTSWMCKACGTTICKSLLIISD